MLLRIAIGSYFVLAGLRKIDNLQSFIQVVQDFHLLPKQLAPLYGIMVPYLEVGAGVLLILGFWTTLAAMIASFLLCTYIVAIGIFPHQSSDLFNKDIIILSGSICLLYTGGGMLSIDKFRKSG